MDGVSVLSSSSDADAVYAVDLEKAIEYAIFNEIPTQNILDSDRINTLYNFFGVIVKYAPVRQEIKQFLVSLREWPVQQNLRNIDSEDFTDKVKNPSEHLTILTFSYIRIDTMLLPTYARRLMSWHASTVPLPAHLKIGRVVAAQSPNCGATLAPYGLSFTPCWPTQLSTETCP